MLSLTSTWVLALELPWISDSPLPPLKAPVAEDERCPISLAEFYHSIASLLEISRKVLYFLFFIFHLILSRARVCVCVRVRACVHPEMSGFIPPSPNTDKDKGILAFNSNCRWRHKSLGSEQVTGDGAELGHGWDSPGPFPRQASWECIKAKQASSALERHRAPSYLSALKHWSLVCEPLETPQQ